MRVVIDPNVLVSAAAASGVSAQLLDRWLTGRPFELVVCPALIGELRNVLARDRFRRWISTVEAERLVARLENEAESWDDPADVPPLTAPVSRERYRSLRRSPCRRAQPRLPRGVVYRAGADPLGVIRAASSARS